MIDLFLSNNRIAVFLEQKKTYERAPQLLEAIISSESSQMTSYIFAERFCQNQLEIYWVIFNVELLKLIHYYGVWVIIITRHKIKTYFNPLQEIW